MAWLRAMGGGSSKKNKILNILDLEWENGSPNATYFNDGNTLKYSVNSKIATRDHLLTSEIFDITDYDTLHLYGSGIQYGTGGYQSEVRLVVNGQTITLFTTNNVNQSRRNMSVIKDVGSYTGEAYIYIRLYSNTGNGYNGTQDINITWGKFITNEKTYLYKDGVQNVEWDNTGYKGKSDWHPSGVTIENNRFYASLSTSGGSYSQSIVTNNEIDLSEYSKINIVYDGINTSSLDISNVKTTAYITVGLLMTSDSKSFLRLTPSSLKENWDEVNVRYGELSITLTNSFIGINRIWLE